MLDIKKFKWEVDYMKKKSNKQNTMTTIKKNIKNTPYIKKGKEMMCGRDILKQWYSWIYKQG